VGTQAPPPQPRKLAKQRCQGAAASTRGRKPSIDAAEMLRLRQDEKLGPRRRRLGIGRASVYRLLGKQAAISANGGVDADPA
jgi:hypothetical protein